MRRPYIVIGIVLVAACIGLLIFRAIRHDENLPTESRTKTRLKVHARSTPSLPAAVSEYQLKRIRSAVRNASASSEDAAATAYFDELLKDGDLGMLHELLAQVKEELRNGGREELRADLINSIINQFSAGNFKKMGVVIDTCYGDGPMAGVFVEDLSLKISATTGLVEQVFSNILENPPQHVDPIFYVDVAGGAASPNNMGPVQALNSIPDPEDGWYGTAAANKIVRNWIYNDAVAASTYIRDLPDSEYRDGLIRHMIQYTAEDDDFERATSWANSLTGTAKESAFELLKKIDDHKKSVSKGK